jgi:hypothetical protein
MPAIPTPGRDISSTPKSSIDKTDPYLWDSQIDEFKNAEPMTVSPSSIDWETEATPESSTPQHSCETSTANSKSESANELENWNPSDFPET